MLWKVSSWYDIEISDQIALDTPPICVMQCHHLSGNRLVYAVDNCVRVVVGSITGEHRFETLYQLQIKRSLWIQQVQIFWNLLVLQQSDGGLVFHDISSERDIEPLNLYSKGSGFKACPYGIVISDFAGNKCNIRHWEDVLFKVRADIGTELDVPFVDMETVIFSNLLIWSKGIAVVDSDKLTIANFWYRNPGEDELIDLK